MNYLREINNFYTWLETNKLSPSAINLWHALMNVCNKTGWRESFTVTESVLCYKTCLTGRTIRNARAELKEKGRIDYESRGGNRCAIYKIIALENMTEKITVNSSDTSSKSTSDTSSTLYKQNKTKNKNNIIKLHKKDRGNYEKYNRDTKEEISFDTSKFLYNGNRE